MACHDDEWFALLDSLERESQLGTGVSFVAEQITAVEHLLQPFQTESARNRHQDSATLSDCVQSPQNM